MRTDALGLKFADRTFRFVRLGPGNDGPRLLAAGAGLIPFDSRNRGGVDPEGRPRLVDALTRAFDREGITGSEVVVVLDGRSVIRTLFVVPPEIATDTEALQERARWEIGQRYGYGQQIPDPMYVACQLRGRRNRMPVIDAWGTHPDLLTSYRQVAEEAGFTIARWVCDGWALHRLYQAYIPDSDRAQLTALVHLEAEGMEIALAEEAGSAVATSLRAERPGALRRSWDPDDPEAVAHEVAWWIGRLTARWLPGSRPDRAEVARLLFTGSLDEPDRLLGALTRALPMRVEMLDLHSILHLDPAAADTPMVRSNLGAFALAAGGALVHLSP